MTLAVDRTDLWLPLLRQLTEVFPRWSIWKNVGSAFAGTGDIDSFAPPGDWPAIQLLFRQWARDEGLGPVIVCRHVPQGPHFVTLQESSPYIIQLDVKERATFRGSTLVDFRTLLPLSEIDELGFRRVRPGVEGVIKLCTNGIAKGGRPNRKGLEEKHVADLLARDPEGLRLGATLLGRAEGALLDGAQALLDGGWDQRAMAMVEGWSFARSLAEPDVMASRWWFLRFTSKRCPLLRIIRQNDRVVPDDRAAFLRDLAPDHEIYPAAVGP